MTRFRTKASLAYGFAMLAGAATFFMGAGGLLQTPFVVGSCVAVMAAILMGRWISSWYRPTGGEGPTFELVFAPLLVLLGAVTCGACAVIGVMALNAPADRVVSASMSFLELATIYIAVIAYGVMVFCAEGWLGLLAGFGTAGIAVAMWSKRAE